MSQNEEMETCNVPSPEEFFLQTPIYEIIPFGVDDTTKIHTIKYFQGTIDAYCPGCGYHSIFEDTTKHVSYEDYNITNDAIFSIKLVCSRNKKHDHFYIIKVKDNTIQKIGQFPSLADLQFPKLERYRKILGKKFSELTRGVGLASHGVGVGAFVYLRRIFENLVEDASVKAKSSPEWNDENYKKARMVERVTMLKGFLPAFLVENSKLYSIISKGIHELTEDECLKYFPIVKVGIELILDEKLEEEKRKKKVKKASKAILNAGATITK